MFTEIFVFFQVVDVQMIILKSAQRRRKHRALAVVRRSQKKIAPPQTPFPGARNGQNLISWRWSISLSTNPVWWGLMHAISSYRGNRPTNTATNKTNTLRRSQLARSLITVQIDYKPNATPSCISSITKRGNRTSKKVYSPKTILWQYCYKMLTIQWQATRRKSFHQAGRP